MFARCTLVVLAVMTPLALGEDAKLNTPPEGFVALFNGKDFTNWRCLRTMDPQKLAAMSEKEREEILTHDNEQLKKHWHVKDGVIVNDGQGCYLTTLEDFKNYELYIDWKILPKGDSGVYLHSTPQIQIWDTTEEGGKWNLGADKGSGGLWNNKDKGKHPLVHADNPLGEWNTFHITMKDGVVTVELNGKLVVDEAPLDNYWDKSKPLPEEGAIQLQTHGGETYWRNIYIRELP